MTPVVTFEDSRSESIATVITTAVSTINSAVPFQQHFHGHSRHKEMGAPARPSVSREVSPQFSIRSDEVKLGFHDNRRWRPVAFYSSRASLVGRERVWSLIGGWILLSLRRIWGVGVRQGGHRHGRSCSSCYLVHWWLSYRLVARLRARWTVWISANVGRAVPHGISFPPRVSICWR